MFFDDFMTRLKKEDGPGLVLLFGDSESVLLEGFRNFKDKFRKNFPDGAVLSFDGVEDGLGPALEAAGTSGLFARDQLVILHRAEKALGGQSDAPVKALKEYFENPNPASRLLLLAPGMKKTSKAVTAVERLGWAVQCSELKDWKMTEWVSTQAREKGISLSPSGTQLLVQRTGSDLAFLQQALEQLALYVYPRKNATDAEVADLPIPGVESGIFPLLDEVGMRRADKAMLLMSRLEDGIDVGTLMLLYMRIRDLLGVAILRAKGRGQSEAAAELGMSPYWMKNLWEQSGKYKPEELKKALLELIGIQAGVVTGRLGKKAQPILLERWVMKWAGKQGLGTRSQVPANR